MVPHAPTARLRVHAGRRQLPVGPARQAGLRPDAAADRPARGEHLLRAADGVPGAGAAGSKVWRDATGLTIYDGFGQTETVNLLANYRCMEVRPGSMGKLTPGFEVCVVDDDGKVLGPRQEGHVAVRVVPERPVGLFREYWKDLEATAGAFRGDWYYTGDRAEVDSDGYFWFVGRSDDGETVAHRTPPVNGSGRRHRSSRGRHLGILRQSRQCLLNFARSSSPRSRRRPSLASARQPGSRR